MFLSRSLCKRRFFRFIACFVTLAFSTSNLSPAELAAPFSVYSSNSNQSTSVPAKNLSQTPKDFSAGVSLPSSLGQIKKIYRGSNRKMVVHVQEAHANEEIQKNIAGILDYFAKNYSLGWVLLEGAEGELVNDFYSFYPKDVKKDVAGYLLRQAKLSGPEYLAILDRPDLKLYGVEDRKLYNANREAYLKALEFKSRDEEISARFGKVLEELSKFAFSEDLRALYRNRRDFQENGERLIRYIRSLIGFAVKVQIDPSEFTGLNSLQQLSELEEDIDFEKAQKDVEPLIRDLKTKLPKERLSRFVTNAAMYGMHKIKRGEYYSYLENEIESIPGSDIKRRYRDCLNYLHYVALYEGITVEVFGELERLEAAVKEKMFRGEEDRRLDRIVRIQSIYQKFFEFTLSKQDVEYFYANRGEFDTKAIKAFIEPLLAKYHFADSLPVNMATLDSDLKQVEKFYALAIERDRVLIERAVRKMEAEKAPVAAIVTGGFHTPGIERYLEEHGYSYVIVTPALESKIDEDKDNELYVNALKGNPFPLVKLFSEIFQPIKSAGLSDPRFQLAVERLMITRDERDRLAGAVRNEYAGAITPRDWVRKDSVMASALMALLHIYRTGDYQRAFDQMIGRAGPEEAEILRWLERFMMGERSITEEKRGTTFESPDRALQLLVSRKDLKPGARLVVGILHHDHGAEAGVRSEIMNSLGVRQFDRSNILRLSENQSLFVAWLSEDEVSLVRERVRRMPERVNRRQIVRRSEARETDQEAFDHANQTLRQGEVAMINNEWDEAERQLEIALELYRKLLKQSKQAELTREVKFNLRLAEMRLRRIGYAKNDEKTYVYDWQTGKKTEKQVYRGEALHKGIPKTSVYVVGITPDGKLMFQMRGEDKYMFPSTLDVTTTGGVTIDDGDSRSAAQREFGEEWFEGRTNAVEDSRFIKVAVDDERDFDHKTFWDIYELVALSNEEHEELSQWVNEFENRELREVPDPFKRIHVIKHPTYRAYFIYTLDESNSARLAQVIESINRQFHIPVSDHLINREFIALHTYQFVPQEMAVITPDQDEGIQGYETLDVDDLDAAFRQKPSRFTNTLPMILQSRRSLEQIKSRAKEARSRSEARSMGLSRSHGEKDRTFLLESMTYYPASLGIGESERREINDDHQQRFIHYLEEAKARTGIQYQLSDRYGEKVAFYDPDEKILYIDRGLARYAPDYDMANQLSRAYFLLVEDMFDHARLFKDGVRYPNIWRQRVAAYKNRPEDFLLLIDFLSGGNYGIIGHGLQQDFDAGMAEPEPEDVEEQYMRLLRMNVDLRRLSARHPYFNRFSELRPGGVDWPERFRQEVPLHWAVTPAQIKEMKHFFAESATAADQISQKLGADKKLKISVVVGLYKERARLMPYDPEDNPTGENALVVKVRQLEELFNGTNIEWELTYVARDESDPDKSGQVALELIAKEFPEYQQSGKVRVIDVHRIIESQDPGFLETVRKQNELGKGTQVMLGMMEAAGNISSPGHEPADIVVYTDADTSIDMRQLARLLSPVVLNHDGTLKMNERGNLESNVVVTGSRYANLGKRSLYNEVDFEDFALPAGVDPLPDAEADRIKIITREYVTKTFFYTPLTRAGLLDTQVALKIYPGGMVRKILPDNVRELIEKRDKRFSFDTELLVMASVHGAVFKEQKILWSDSPWQSTVDTPERRWQYFRDWITQYKRLVKNKKVPATFSPEDLERITELAKRGQRLSHKGQPTTDLVTRLKAIIIQTADKYLAYPAKLSVERNGEEIHARHDNLLKYLNLFNRAGFPELHTESMKDRPLAVFNPETNQVVLDDALALIAPDFENAKGRRAFKAFLTDVLRVVNGIPNVYTRQDSIKHLKAHQDEAKVVFSFLDGRLDVILYTDPDYSMQIAINAQQGGYQPRDRAEARKMHAANVPEMPVTAIWHTGIPTKKAPGAEALTGEGENFLASLVKESLKDERVYITPQAITQYQDNLESLTGTMQAQPDSNDSAKRKRSWLEEVPDEVVKHIEKVFRVGTKAYDKNRAQQNFEPITFVERLLFLLANKRIRFMRHQFLRPSLNANGSRTAERIADENWMKALAEKQGYGNLLFDDYLFPRLDPYVNPMGDMAFLTYMYQKGESSPITEEEYLNLRRRLAQMEEVAKGTTNEEERTKYRSRVQTLKKELAGYEAILVINVTDALWKQKWNQEGDRATEHKKKDVAFLSQLVIAEAAERLIGSPDKISLHKQAVLLEMVLASRNARGKGVSDLNYWYLTHAAGKAMDSGAIPNYSAYYSKVLKASYRQYLQKLYRDYRIEADTTVGSFRTLLRSVGKAAIGSAFQQRDEQSAAIPTMRADSFVKKAAGTTDVPTDVVRKLQQKYHGTGVEQAFKRLGDAANTPPTTELKAVYEWIKRRNIGNIYNGLLEMLSTGNLVFMIHDNAQEPFFQRYDQASWLPGIMFFPAKRSSFGPYEIHMTRNLWDRVWGNVSKSKRDRAAFLAEILVFTYTQNVLPVGDDVGLHVWASTMTQHFGSDRAISHGINDLELFYLDDAEINENSQYFLTLIWRYRSSMDPLGAFKRAIYMRMARLDQGPKLVDAIESPENLLAYYSYLFEYKYAALPAGERVKKISQYLDKLAASKGRKNHPVWKMIRKGGGKAEDGRSYFFKYRDTVHDVSYWVPQNLGGFLRFKNDESGQNNLNKAIKAKQRKAVKKVNRELKALEAERETLIKRQSATAASGDERIKRIDARIEELLKEIGGSIAELTNTPFVQWFRDRVENVRHHKVSRGSRNRNVVFVGVYGVSSSGKTTLVKQLEEMLKKVYGDKKVCSISSDSYLIPGSLRKFSKKTVIRGQAIYDLYAAERDMNDLRNRRKIYVRVDTHGKKQEPIQVIDGDQVEIVLLDLTAFGLDVHLEKYIDFVVPILFKKDEHRLKRRIRRDQKPPRNMSVEDIVGDMVEKQFQELYGTVYEALGRFMGDANKNVIWVQDDGIAGKLKSISEENFEMIGTTNVQALTLVKKKRGKNKRSESRMPVEGYAEMEKLLGPQSYAAFKHAVDSATEIGIRRYKQSKRAWIAAEKKKDKPNQAAIAKALKKIATVRQRIEIQNQKALVELHLALKRITNVKDLEIPARMELLWILSEIYPMVLPYLIRGQEGNPIQHTVYALNFMAEILSGEKLSGQQKAALEYVKTGLLAILVHDAGLGEAQLPKITEKMILDAPESERPAKRQAGIAARMEHMKLGAGILGDIARLYLAAERKNPYPDPLPSKTLARAMQIIRMHDNSKIPLLEPTVRRQWLLSPPADGQEDHDWLAQLHWESDALWMLSLEGLLWDLSNDGAPETSENLIGKISFNLSLHREVIDLYRKAYTPEEMARFKFQDGTLYRSQTGYAIALRLKNELLDQTLPDILQKYAGVSATAGEPIDRGMLLSEMLGHREAEARKVAAHALGLLQDNRFIDRIAGLLFDKDAGVRKAACTALLNLKQPRKITETYAVAIRNAAHPIHSDPEIVRQAMTTFGDIGDLVAVDVVDKYADSFFKDQKLQDSAYDALVKLGQEAVQQLQRAAAIAIESNDDVLAKLLQAKATAPQLTSKAVKIPATEADWKLFLDGNDKAFGYFNAASRFASQRSEARRDEGSESRTLVLRDEEQGEARRDEGSESRTLVLRDEEQGEARRDEQIKAVVRSEARHPEEIIRQIDKLMALLSTPSITTKKAPSTRGLFSVEERFFDRLADLLIRGNANNQFTRIEEVSVPVIDRIKEAFPVDDDRMSAILNGDREPDTFVERLLFLLANRRIRFAIDRLGPDERGPGVSDPRNMIQSLAEGLGYQGLVHDEYLYPRLSPNNDMLGVLSFASLAYEHARKRDSMITSHQFNEKEEELNAAQIVLEGLLNSRNALIQQANQGLLILDTNSDYEVVRDKIQDQRRIIDRIKKEIAEYAGQPVYLIHITQAVWDQIMNPLFEGPSHLRVDGETTQSQPSQPVWSHFLAQLVVGEAAERLLGSPERITRHKQASILEMYLASNGAREKGISDLDFWFMNHAAMARPELYNEGYRGFYNKELRSRYVQYLDRMNTNYDISKDPTIGSFYLQLWGIARKAGVPFTRKKKDRSELYEEQTMRPDRFVPKAPGSLDVPQTDIDFMETNYRGRGAEHARPPHGERYVVNSQIIRWIGVDRAIGQIYKGLVDMLESGKMVFAVDDLGDEVFYPRSDLDPSMPGVLFFATEAEDGKYEIHVSRKLWEQKGYTHEQHEDVPADAVSFLAQILVFCYTQNVLPTGLEIGRHDWARMMTLHFGSQSAALAGVTDIDLYYLDYAASHGNVRFFYDLLWGYRSSRDAMGNFKQAVYRYLQKVEDQVGSDVLAQGIKQPADLLVYYGYLFEHKFKTVLIKKRHVAVAECLNDLRDRNVNPVVTQILRDAAVVNPDDIGKQYLFHHQLGNQTEAYIPQNIGAFMTFVDLPRSEGTQLRNLTEGETNRLQDIKRNIAAAEEAINHQRQSKRGLRPEDTQHSTINNRLAVIHKLKDTKQAEMADISNRPFIEWVLADVAQQRLVKAAIGDMNLVIVGLYGLSSTGKTTLTAQLVKQLRAVYGNDKVNYISSDSYLQPSNMRTIKGKKVMRGPAIYDLQAAERDLTDIENRETVYVRQDIHGRDKEAKRSAYREVDGSQVEVLVLDLTAFGLDRGIAAHVDRLIPIVFRDDRTRNDRRISRDTVSKEEGGERGKTEAEITNDMIEKQYEELFAVMLEKIEAYRYDPMKNRIYMQDRNRMVLFDEPDGRVAARSEAREASLDKPLNAQMPQTYAKPDSEAAGIAGGVVAVQEIRWQKVLRKVFTHSGTSEALAQNFDRELAVMVQTALAAHGSFDVSRDVSAPGASIYEWKSDAATDAQIDFLKGMLENLQPSMKLAVTINQETKQAVQIQSLIERQFAGRISVFTSDIGIIAEKLRLDLKIHPENVVQVTGVHTMLRMKDADLLRRGIASALAGTIPSHIVIVGDGKQGFSSMAVMPSQLDIDRIVSDWLEAEKLKTSA